MHSQIHRTYAKPGTDTGFARFFSINAASPSKAASPEGTKSASVPVYAYVLLKMGKAA